MMCDECSDIIDHLKALIQIDAEYVGKLKQQRDELLEACEAMLAISNSAYMAWHPAFVKARAAIAKAKEEQTDV